jgi:hypothetical protein
VEEANRRLKEEAEAAHKPETPDPFEELQRRLGEATAEIEGMEPKMEEWQTKSQACVDRSERLEAFVSTTTSETKLHPCRRTAGVIN